MCLILLRISDFWTLSQSWDLVLYFFNLLNLHPSWRESKPSCFPLVWAGVGTSLVLALQYLLASCCPVALSKVCPGQWWRWSWEHLGGSHPVLITLSWEDLHSDVFYTKQLLPKSHGCWEWHHAVEPSNFWGISLIWLDENKDFSGRSPKYKSKTSPKVSPPFSLLQRYSYVIRSFFFHGFVFEELYFLVTCVHNMKKGL